MVIFLLKFVFILVEQSV